MNWRSRLIATVYPEEATNKDVTWESDDTTVATVSDDGWVTPVKAGTATITVKTKDGGKTAQCVVTVIESVASVSLHKNTLSFEKGKTSKLTATVSPSNATDRSVVWKSSNTKIATVTNKGVVKGIKAGTATITVVTKDGNKKATCKVTVKNPVVKVKGVKISKKTAIIKNGKTITLKATISPSNATNKAVTWKTSDKKIATVTSNGVVKGVKKGKTTIIATTKDGKKTAKCAVTVK